MIILIVEDDPDKRDSIVDYLHSIKKIKFELIVKGSINSGLRELILNKKIAFIILDMSMPCLDVSDVDSTGGGLESFGGEQFLEQMSLREIFKPVVVVSQLGSFGKDGRKKSLNTLNSELKKEYTKFYLGSIFYNSAMGDWKTELKTIIFKECENR